MADLRAVFSDPQVLAQEMVLEVEHPGHGPVRMAGFPVKFSATPCRVRLPAPELGAHTEEVLSELGLQGELARLQYLLSRTPLYPIGFPCVLRTGRLCSRRRVLGA